MSMLVRERPRATPPRRRLLEGFASLPRGFRFFLLPLSVAGLADFSSTLLILWASDGMTPTYGRGRASAVAMGLYVLYNAVYAGSCLVAGRLADRFPKRAVLAAGYALASVPAGLLLWPSAALVKYTLVFVTSGVYMGLWETVESATAATYLPPESRGTGFGAMDAVNGVADVASSVLVGALWTLAPSVAMGFVITTSLVGATLLVVAVPANPTDED
jgi:MFS family permease